VGSEKNKPPSTDKVTKKSLGEMLVEEKLVTPAQLESALALQRQQGGKLSDIGLQQGVIKAEQLATVLSIKLNLPLIDLKRHTIQPRAPRLIPEDMAWRHMLIPLDIVNDSLMVVMADPEDIRTIEDIKTQAGMRIEVALGVLSDIEPYLMDLQPLALARAASRREAIIVNMEPDCFDIVSLPGEFLR
jgi:type IV pilus assembly protein PilB